MAILNVHHRTSYRYSQPVAFGEHRLMCRPRDSHDLRLIDTTLLIDPPPSALRWIHDVFGNSIAIASFAEPSTEFRETGGKLHGVQLWVKLPKKDKMISPHYQEIPSANIPSSAARSR